MEKKEDFDFLNTLFDDQVTYNYIPKIENKAGIDNVNFIAELKTIELANNMRYAIVGLNVVYFYLLLEQRFFFFQKFKLLMIFVVPVSIYSYGFYISRNPINKILNPLFKEDFKLHRAGVNKLKNNNSSNLDNYIDYFGKLSHSRDSDSNLSKFQNIDKYRLYDHLKFISEWLYEPMDVEFENKLYFIENSDDVINKEFRNRGNDDDEYLGLRYKKLQDNYHN